MSKARLTTGSLSRSACSRGSPSIACFSETGAGGVLRHQLAELVDLAVRHLQYAADIAQNAARLQRAEGYDLRHLVAPIALLHITDHLVAAVLAEIDVEIGHRHALGVEKPLEQQPEADRIEIGDGERVRNERTRARTAARTNGYALFLRPLDEVGYDQEIARIFHSRDNAQLEVEPLAVFINSVARRNPGGREAALEPRFGAPAQFARLVERPAIIADGKARKNRLVRARPERAALAQSPLSRQRLPADRQSVQPFPRGT